MSFSCVSDSLCSISINILLEKRFWKFFRAFRLVVGCATGRATGCVVGLDWFVGVGLLCVGLLGG